MKISYDKIHIMCRNCWLSNCCPSECIRFELYCCFRRPRRWRNAIMCGDARASYYSGSRLTLVIDQLFTAEHTWCNVKLLSTGHYEIHTWMTYKSWYRFIIKMMHYQSCRQNIVHIMCELLKTYVWRLYNYNVWQQQYIRGNNHPDNC